MPSPNVKILGGDQAVSSNGLVTSLIVIAKPCRLYKFTAFNTNVAARFFQIFDSATLPAEGATPTLPPYQAAAATGQVGDWWQDGRWMRNGIVIVSSSTATTKTISAADAMIDCMFRVMPG